MADTPSRISNKPLTDGRVGARLKSLRANRGWSLEKLAEASGVSRSMLSQIERDRANPTLAVTLRIVRALGIGIGEFVEHPGASSSVSIIRAPDRAHRFRSDERCAIRALSPLHLEKDVEFYEVQLRPGGALRGAAHFEGAREFLTVGKGRVRVESGPDREILERGDSARYRAAVPHAIVNIGRGVAVLFLVTIRR